MSNLTRWLLGLVLVAALAGAYYYFSGPKKVVQADNLTTAAKKGAFHVKAIANGELKAKRSEKIMGPSGMRTSGIWQTAIQDMVAEGTVVKAGDYVATLDRTEVTNKIRDAQTEIEKTQTQLDQAKIDTAIEMRGLRDQMVNLQFSIKEKRLELELSRYEAKSVIQQKELDLERTQRDYNQLTTKLQLTKEKSEAKVLEITTQLKQQQDKLNILSQLASQFTVTAPKDGMVIYARDWDGKVAPGSQIRAWDPVVAELPDLTDMVSLSYVNEVDISRVKEGQDVKIKVDAFPDNDYSGKVIKVANIGEQLKGYDAKVFEVTVQLLESDSILRPAMTSSNEIVTDIYEDVVYIPLEALQADSLTYVFKDFEGKIVKQEVITGASNDDEIIIAHGLEGNENIFLSVPENAKDLTFFPIDPNVKDGIRRQLAEDRQRRAEEAAEKMRSLKKEDLPPSTQGGGGGFIIIN